MLLPIRTPFAHLAQYTVFAPQTLDNLWFFLFLLSITVVPSAYLANKQSAGFFLEIGQ